MAVKEHSTYHPGSALERAVLDLVRVGSSGRSSDVRRLASRLLHTVPDGVADADRFRDAVHQAMVIANNFEGSWGTAGELPTENGSQLPLVDIDHLPTGAGLHLSPEVFGDLQEIVAERQQADVLRRAGAGLTRTLLLSGAPGVGKTMAAHWLAEHLELPLLSLDLASIVSSYLGTSGRNIKTVLDYAQGGECVLLLDEFDAIAKKREDDTDVGELKRIVNVILVELDRWPDTSLLVAATNHPQLLDPAVGRRFDRTLSLPLPGLDERWEILRALSSGHGCDETTLLRVVAEATAGASGSDLTRMWRLALRRSILNHSSLEEELLCLVVRGHSEPGPDRDNLFFAMNRLLNFPCRKIGRLVGVSHPTVAASIRRAESKDNDSSIR